MYNGDLIMSGFRKAMNGRLFEPTVMFFGLTNSPATFQTMMNHILKDLINEGKVTMYLDDILIFTKDLIEHCEIINRVLQILRENKLSLEQQKCEFEKEEMKYLGMIIGHGKVRMDPVKVAAVADWPIPKNKKEIQQFLGFANY
jgi:Reverse transcriptase (RNA-dependent DNA polymerase)